jgi:SNF2 family DNA or RNA helicase
VNSLNLLSSSQQDAVTHIYENDGTYLIGDMGSGKTVTALAAAAELLADKVVSKVLVLAPVRVCKKVWAHECEKWEELNHLNVGVACGTPKQRENVLCNSGYDIVCTNYENLSTLFEFYKGKTLPFDMLVVDEVTKLKAGGKHFKALRKHIPKFKIRVTMTGTPVSEGYEQLFYPMMIVDNGEALGRNKQNFLHQYFVATDYNQYNWEIQPYFGAELLMEKIDHLIFLLPDYRHELPTLHEHVHTVTLDQKAKDYYRVMERDMVLSLNDSDGPITAANAAVLTGKLQQLACGFIYTEDGGVRRVHNAKLDALVDLCSEIAYREGDDTQFLIVYQYKAELEVLREHFASFIVALDGNRDIEKIDAWKNGEVPLLAVHPKSAGHGLDFTNAHHVIFMSPIWSRDLMRQTIARIWRRNQTEECTSTVLCAEGTIDEEIIKRESEKASHYDILLQHLNDKAGLVA